jgi:heat shock protein HslJ
MTRSHGASAAILLSLIVAACGTTPAGPPERLEGTAWRAAAIDGKPPLTSNPSTLRFFDRQWAGGSLACNAYSTTYFADASGLRFGALAPTRETCAAAVMEQETRFIAVLAATRGLRLDDQGALLLLDADGSTRVRLVPMTQ